MEYPLISVLMPVYNVENFIEEAVTSITNQTYKNIELIIIDDCSTDSTYTKIQTLALKDKRIKLYKNDKNKKIVETLNYGLQKAKGEFIVRMDGDDTCVPNRIEKMWKYLCTHSEIALVGSYINTINESGEIIKSYKKEIENSKILKYCKYSTPVYHIWMTTKKIYDEIGEYRMPYAEDYDYLLRILSHGYAISNIDEYLYNVRIRSGNTISTAGMKQHLTAKYAYDLYKQRLKYKTNKDNYSDAELERKTTSSKLRLSLFKKSMEYYIKGVSCRKQNKLKSILYLIASFIFDPKYRFELIYNKIMLRFI